MHSETQPTRIAMWSGPRNISTAMMRSWEARGDCHVIDEPFYAHYLATTGAPHPGREAILAAHPADWDDVVRIITGPTPRGEPVFYQKHMAHHIPVDCLNHEDALDPRLQWIDGMRHAILIRTPAEMLASLANVIDVPNAYATGLPQQIWLYETLAARGQTPPVIDARDVLENPCGMLAVLCDALGVPFTEKMLSWPPGARATDGVWGRHWYANVNKSTGFAAYVPKSVEIAGELREILRECEPLYARLAAERIRVS